ncbi:MAG: hypothetical protein KJI69_05430 [Patescibacteria group bacterium]|nr:hypothetical protein [Patescibacteria group bacterium]
MARKKKKSPVFAIIIIIGIVVVGFAFLDVQLSDIIPLGLLETSRNINCDGVECRLSFGFSQGNFDGNPITETLPLTEVDLNAPILAEFRIEPATAFGGVPVGCETISNDNSLQKMNLEAFSLQTGSTVPTLMTSIPESEFAIDDRDRDIVLPQDIQPLLTQGQDILNLELVAGVCSVGDINYFIFNGRCFSPSVPPAVDAVCTRGSSGALINFIKRPPELQPNSNPLLKLNDYLNENEITETLTSFAVAESFTLADPTIITDITMKISARDPTTGLGAVNTIVTAFIWNLDAVPPERVTQSQALGGFGVISAEVNFKFLDTVLLMPSTNYAVGIRVEQNLGNEFRYAQFDQSATTHECVIDRNIVSETSFETSFVSNGLCGIDIFHDRLLTQTLLGTGQAGGEQGIQGIQGIEGLEGIQGIQGIQGEQSIPLTQEELIAILCDGSETEPEICQRSDFLFPFLQIGDTSFGLLILIGVIIIVVGLIGIIVRRR